MNSQLVSRATKKELDADGDGFVSDDDLVKSERILQIEHMDKMQDQQRYMAWSALGLPVLLVLIMLLPWVPVEKIDAVMGIVTTFVASMGTIITVFIGGTAYVRGKMNNKEQE